MRALSVDLKFEVLKGLAFVAIGAFLCAKFSPSPVAPELPKTEIKQEQIGKCKATVTKRTNADGSHDEITEFLAQSQQKQDIVADAKKEKNHTIGLVPRYDFKNKSGDVAGFYTYKDLGVFLSRDEIGFVLQRRF